MKFKPTRTKQKSADVEGPSSSPALCALCDLCPGETGVVQETLWLEAHAALLESYGFFPGSAVTRVGSAPQGDPLVFRLDGRLIAVRRETAAEIKVLRENK